MISMGVHCYYIKNIGAINSFNFALRLHHMMPSQNDLEEFKAARKEIKFVVFYLLELVHLKILNTEREYSLQPEFIG